MNTQSTQTDAVVQPAAGAQSLAAVPFDMQQALQPTLSAMPVLELDAVSTTGADFATAMLAAESRSVENDAFLAMQAFTAAPWVVMQEAQPAAVQPWQQTRAPDVGGSVKSWPAAASVRTGAEPLTQRTSPPAPWSSAAAELATAGELPSMDQPEGMQAAMSASVASTSKVAGASRVELPAVAVRSAEQPLVQALGQRIQWQQAQGAEVATVRLDPPQWGQLEIRIRQEAGSVQVHLHASHAEVGRQLTTLVEGLRQELQQRVADAQVMVSHGRMAQQGQGQGESSRHAHQDEQLPIGLALQADADEASA